MKHITKEMLRIYKPISNLDWMNYKLVRDKATFHHIVKRENGGKEVLENGAILMPEAHQYLHIIEYKEADVYKMLENMFMMINAQGYEPTEEQRFVIEYLLCGFESRHKDDENSKGKRLIRHKYLNRGYTPKR